MVGGCGGGGGGVLENNGGIVPGIPAGRWR